MAELVRVCRDPSVVETIVDFRNTHGTKDAEWVPKISQDEWVVISADRGKSNRGQKLPRLCKDFGVRHVLLSNRIHELKQFAKIRAILSVWDGLFGVMNSPAGTRFLLKIHDGRASLVKEST